MRIIKPKRIREYIARFPTAKGGLEHWLTNARTGRWEHLLDVRKTFPHADEVKVRSGRKVVVFNIKRNDFRLITAIHYNLGKVFVLLFITHAQYDKEIWKDYVHQDARDSVPIRTREIQFRNLPRDYTGLILLFPLRPLHDQTEADNATEIIDAMAGHDLTADQEDYFDVLSTLIEEYENEHDPVVLSARKPVANLRRLMADHGMTASDLGRVLGNRTLGSKILRGERRLSIGNIKIR